MQSFLNILALLFLAVVAKADPGPTSPDSTSVFNQGSTCTIQWTPDTSGVWKIMNVELMTGDNFHMIHLSTVASNLDGTNPNNDTFSYPCLPVTPNSAIYFYQFSSPYSPDLLWTTRFTLAGPNGETTPPPNATQPTTNAPIPWGVGALQDPSLAVAPPAAPNSLNSTANGTATGSPTGSAAPSGSANSTLSSGLPTVTPSPTGANSSTPSGFTTSAASPNATSSKSANGTSSSTSSTTSSSSTSGAKALIVTSSVAMLVTVPLMALTFLL
ncbi:hypothetical protein SISNIDRAFT_439541 [Sistotremastrum niveocremeum HHB9708]|uniref:Ser-Thr-rich glycosyl-phosphatidyl-inositol-anchored membrane family-domain-containing protein n=1 Tax=Sistotremastrum niveocremeum HHB9708 TaxID=1314777 RepID=A0A164W5B6_9AGAM|nr:hypothetical protein SISNIDRAFT_439541 [Sistotremastrum niveocremeum HHB9708]